MIHKFIGSFWQRWIHYCEPSTVVVPLEFTTQHQTNAPPKHGTYVTYEVHVKSSISAGGVTHL